MVAEISTQRRDLSTAKRRGGRGTVWTYWRAIVIDR